MLVSNKQRNFSFRKFGSGKRLDVSVNAVAMMVYPSCFSVLKHDNTESNILKSSHLLALELDALPTRLGLNGFSFSNTKYTF